MAQLVKGGSPCSSTWLPYFCRSGQRETSLEEFTHEVEGCLFFLRCFCLGFLVVCLLMWFTGSLDG